VGVAAMKPYVIWSPDYRRVSGGIRVLYLLGKLLRNRGLQAEMKMTHGPFVDNPWSVPECVEIPDDAIHIYPEIVEGNPSGSDRVVWWLLNHASKDGLQFVWHPNINQSPVLNVPYLEPDLFYPGDGERSGVLVWVGKGRDGYVPNGARLITHSWPASRKELADVLRSSEYLISFDPYTAIVHEATLCGCPVVLVGNDRWSIDHLSSGPMKIFGVVDCVSKLDQARSEIGASFESYVAYFPTMAEQLNVFIQRTQELVGR
jgi:hypothetical protein